MPLMHFHRLLITACLLCTVITAHAVPTVAPWIDKTEDGGVRVHLYFFWSQRCPHCLEAIPFVQSLAHDYPIPLPTTFPDAALNLEREDEIRDAL
jgi:thiol-disulfide isomerase/thioredoxin